MLHRLLREKQIRDEEFVEICKLRQGAALHTLDALLELPVSRNNSNQSKFSFLGQLGTFNFDFISVIILASLFAQKDSIDQSNLSDSLRQYLPSPNRSCSFNNGIKFQRAAHPHQFVGILSSSLEV